MALLKFIFCLALSVSAIFAYAMPPKFVPIKAGTFMMGCSTSDWTCKELEHPQHQVTISKDFDLQTTEVTQQQWYDVMKTNPSHYKTAGTCGIEAIVISGTKLCPDNPVENMSRYDMEQFIQNLNQNEDGYVYRLPTEAEWEYSARGGTTTRYSYGDDPDQIGSYGWVYNESGFDGTFRVASKLPNPFGLYDMIGNVGELVNENYVKYESDPQVDPNKPCSSKIWTCTQVIRGGDFSNPPKSATSAARLDFSQGNSFSNVGFRLVRVPKASARK